MSADARGNAAGDERRVRETIEVLADRFPCRRAGSDDERGAQEWVRVELERAGLSAEVEPFRFTGNLYATMALHFGVGTAGAIVAAFSPAVAAVLHWLTARSYQGESNRRGHLLRRLQPQVDSQNLVLVLPAKGALRRRVVIPAHIDAAFTGLIFHPTVLRRAGGGRSGETQPYHARSMRLVTDTQYALFASAALRALTGFGGWPWRLIEVALAVPALLAFLLNLEVVLRNRTVVGAADNLSGVAAAMLLAERFAASRPDGVEIVVVFTGAEEAGTGGAQRLVERHAHKWKPDDTVVIGVDTVSNGDLRWFVDGELAPIPIAPWLEAELVALAATDERYRTMRPFQIPAGATDAMPFLARGFPGVTIGCVDTDYGAPRHYHHPSDLPGNTDPATVVAAADFVEQLVWRIGSLE